jgi:thymidylate kinase
MPQPDLVFFLDAPPEVLLDRKQEVSREALEKSRERYLRLCQTSDRFRVVDASQPLDAVTDMVFERISVLNRQADTVGRDFQR